MQVGDAFITFSKKLQAYFLGQVSDAKASSITLQWSMFKKNPTNQIVRDCNVLIMCSFSQLMLMIFFHSHCIYHHQTTI